MSTRTEAGVSTRAAIIAGLLYGLCVYAAWPPVNAWPLALVSAAVLMWVGARATTRPARLALGFAIGTWPLWFSQQAWLINVTPVGYPLLVLYMSFWSGLGVWGIARVRRAWPRLPMVVAGPLVWMAVEVLRGEVVLTGYGWFHLAHPLIARPMLAAPAAALGTYFVSFLAAALVGGLLDAVDAVRTREQRSRSLGLAVTSLVVVAAGWFAAASDARARPAPDAGTVHVGVVQTNLPQGLKLAWSADRVRSDFARFVELTRQVGAAEPRPDVIVWPETMFPGVSLNDDAVATFEAVFRANTPNVKPDDQTLNGAMNAAIRQLQAEIGIPLVIGSNEVEGPRVERAPGQARSEFDYERRYNSAVVIQGGQVEAPPNRYDKIDLTPFGEVIPYVWRWPALQRAVLALGAGGMRFDLSPGQRAQPLRVRLVRTDNDASQSKPAELLLAAPICFEATRSGLCRRLAVGAGDGRLADVLLNLSNDGWFGDIRNAPVNSDAGRAQHLLAARWRCVELGRPMVRSVNTGISGAIDARGQLLPVKIVTGLATSTRSDGALVATVTLGTKATLFSRIGHVFAWIAVGLGWAVIGLAVVTSLRRSRTIEAVAR